MNAKMKELEYTDFPIGDEVIDPPAEHTELAKPGTFEGMAFVNPDDIPDLDTAEVGINIAPQYMEFTIAGESTRAVYNGMTTIHSNKNNNQREIATVVFQNRKGVWINSGANLVNQLRTLKPGTLIEIKYLGKEKTSNGNEIKKFEVHILNLNILKKA